MIRLFSRRRRTVTPEESSLWRTVMRDVEPLPGRKSAAAPPAPSPPPVTAEPASGVPNGVPSGASGPPPAQRPAARAPLPPLEPGGMAAALDRRTDERLRRGQMDIQGRIDLHGMVQSEAHAALNAFIHRSWREQRRCVLVITGKGTYKEGGGVLHRMVPRWLNEAPLRSMVLAMHRAQSMHGGDGALYVLLKRRRDGVERGR
ncbi:MAG TPA: Smr/MutS family protein [Azospirillaceae bacterium]|nr:Smr/MutS family protein [Azospirillaceae bacterium]